MTSLSELMPLISTWVRFIQRHSRACGPIFTELISRVDSKMAIWEELVNDTADLKPIGLSLQWKLVIYTSRLHWLTHSVKWIAPKTRAIFTNQGKSLLIFKNQISTFTWFHNDPSFQKAQKFIPIEMMWSPEKKNYSWENFSATFWSVTTVLILAGLSTSYRVMCLLRDSVSVSSINITTVARFFFILHVSLQGGSLVKSLKIFTSLHGNS